MIKYKLYTFSGATYIVPLDKYEYVDNTVGKHFEDYCTGLLTSHELDRFVEEAILDNGGNALYCKVFSKECHPSNNEWVVWTGTRFYC